MAGKGKELRAKVKELTEALEKEQSANKLSTAEFQVRALESLKHLPIGINFRMGCHASLLHAQLHQLLGRPFCERQKARGSNPKSAAWDLLQPRCSSLADPLLGLEVLRP